MNPKQLAQRTEDDELDDLLGELAGESIPTILKVRPNKRGHINLGPIEIMILRNAISNIASVQAETGATLAALAHAFRAVQYEGHISSNDASAFSVVASAQAERAHSNVAKLYALVN
ncbi:MAG: hypothetical protein WB870_16935 [Gallionellaceae bacterium]